MTGADESIEYDTCTCIVITHHGGEAHQHDPSCPVHAHEYAARASLEEAWT